jgi:para-nitrobenzyl esterase
MVTTITSGKVSGYEDDGVAVFKGIPFAKSPFGEHRFAAPVPPDPWEGTFQATAYGPRPPQSSIMPGQQPWTSAEGLDILTVNVWTPEPGGEGLPVMVWIYGGAYEMGSADWPEYDGTRLAKHGVVLVTFNYRVGMEGFVQVEGAPSNRGLLDQVAALRWVRDNIGAFGGDPGNVTIFGESAGAGSVAALLAMPMAEGLFTRAIAQSVPGVFFSTDYADRVAGEVMRRAGGGSPYDRTPEELLAAVRAVADEEMRGDPGRWGKMAYSTLPVAPVVDGEILPATPWDALAAGASRDVALIVGFNRDEYRTFFAMNPPATLDVHGMLKALAPAGAEDAYRAGLPGVGEEELFVHLMSDWMFRMPCVLLADAHTGPTYLYELTWAPDSLLGACHGLDVPLAFGATSGPIVMMMAGGSPDLEGVSEQFRTAWTGFAATGDPGWPRYEAGMTHLFDVESSDVADPEAVSHAIWSARDFPAL